LRKIVFIFGIIALLSTLGAAQTRDNGGRTPETVVERFCRLDQDGALLSPEGIQQIQPNLMWLPTPKWLNMYVVRNSRVVGQKITGSKDASVTVEYDRLGYIKNGKFEAARATRRSVYQLQMSEEEWKQVDGESVLQESEPRWRLRRQTQPHLSISAAISYLQKLQNESADDSERADYEQQIALLKDAERIAQVTPAPQATSTTAEQRPIR
jgi:hypothetical protein